MNKEFDEIIRLVAKEHNVTVEKVKQDMKKGLEDSLNNPNKDIQKIWKACPKKDDDISTEDALQFFANLIRSANEENE